MGKNAPLKICIFDGHMNLSRPDNLSWRLMITADPMATIEPVNPAARTDRPFFD